MDADRLNIDELEDLGLDPGMTVVDATKPPGPPGTGRRSRGPGSDADGWMMRSPLWAIPLVVSVIFGIERLLMLAIVPGWRDLPIIVFGSLFILTFAVVLALGGVFIGQHRR